MPALRHRHTLSIEVEPTNHLRVPNELEILSPTPRAFTFAINSDNVLTPLSSSFHEQVSAQVNTPEPVPRSWSPSASDTSSSAWSPSDTSSGASSGASYSSTSSIQTPADGAPIPRKGDDGYVKRPENAFILFRRKCCEDKNAALQAVKTETDDDKPIKRQRQADLSKTISQQWKELSAEEKKVWEDQAKEKKREHEAKHPDYVYRPQRKSKKKKPKRGDIDDGEASFTVRVPMPRRGQYVPTPPPFPDSSTPNAYMTPGSAPPSRRQSISDQEIEFRPRARGASYAGYESDPAAPPYHRSMSLRLGIPQYMPSPNLFSPVSDGSSPESDAFSPIDRLTGPFSQLSATFSPVSPESPFSPDTTYSLAQAQQQQYPPPIIQYGPLDPAPFQQPQFQSVWDDVNLWEGAERYDMSTANCDLGMPQSSEDEVMPKHAAGEDHSEPEQDTFDYAYALPVPTRDSTFYYDEGALPDQQQHWQPTFTHY